MTPLLKKPAVDSSSSSGNYRAISKLSTISRVLQTTRVDKLACVLIYSTQPTLASTSQHTGRGRHSTETALLDVLDGVDTAAAEC